MTRQDRIEAILTAHNAAVRDLQHGRTEMRSAHRHLVEAMHAMEAWAAAHDAGADLYDQALLAVVDANHAALALLREPE